MAAMNATEVATGKNVEKTRKNCYCETCDDLHNTRIEWYVCERLQRQESRRQGESISIIIHPNQR